MCLTWSIWHMYEMCVCFLQFICCVFSSFYWCLFSPCFMSIMPHSHNYDGVLFAGLKWKAHCDEMWYINKNDIDIHTKQANLSFSVTQSIAPVRTTSRSCYHGHMCVWENLHNSSWLWAVDWKINQRTHKTELWEYIFTDESIYINKNAINNSRHMEMSDVFAYTHQNPVFAITFGCLKNEC